MSIRERLGINDTARRDALELLCAEVVDLVCGERQDSYGTPGESHERTAQLWSAIFGVEVSAEQVCIAMCALKLGRMVGALERGGDVGDSLRDAIGYALNLSEVVA